MMRKFIFLSAICSILFLNSQVFAQNNEPKPQITSGTLDLLASLNGFGIFGVSGPNGNGSGDPRITEGIGLRYFLSDQWSLRALASFGSQTNVVGPSNGEGGAPSDSGKISLFGLGAAIEYHLHQVYSTDIYLSAGAGYKTTTRTNLGIQLNFQPNQGLPTPQAATTTDETLSVNAFGITVAAGFDWYLWHGIALGAEYSLGWVTSSGTYTSHAGTTTDMNFGNGFGISGGANIHLVVVF